MRDPDLTQDQEEFYLVLPSYQRGLVWKSEKKTSLIDSMHKGFPIGSLLVYKSKDDRPDGRVSLQVIDGLQRTSAIVDYDKSKMSIAPISEEFIGGSTYIQMLSILDKSDAQISLDALKKAVQKWAVKTKTTDNADGFESKVLRQSIEEHCEITLPADVCAELEALIAKQVLDKLRKDFEKISQYEVPVIVYTGSESNLPVIFESLNSGTPLSKYDKFNASWNSYTAFTTNIAIKKAVSARFKAYQKEGWEVIGVNTSGELGDKDLNLFMYLSGLGKVLSDSYPCLFKKVSASGEPPSTGFVLATVAHGLRVNDMDQLPETLGPKDQDIYLDTFVEAIKDVCDILNVEFERFLGLRLNQRKQSDRFLPHSENQILSLILRVLIEKYDTKTWIKRNAFKDKDLAPLIDNLSAHYVKDILSEAWRGSGDSTLYERVWTSIEESEDLVPSDWYMKALSSVEIRQAIDSFNNEELGKLTKNRTSLSTKTKLVLRLVYMNIVSHSDQVGTQFDIEHLCPVSELSDLVVASSERGLPMNNLGNLAILPHDYNIIKGKLYIGDHEEKFPEKFGTQDFNKFVITPDVTDIKKTAITDENSFLAFCNTRYAFMKEIITKNLAAKK